MIPFGGCWEWFTAEQQSPGAQNHNKRQRQCWRRGLWWVEGDREGGIVSPLLQSCLLRFPLPLLTSSSGLEKLLKSLRQRRLLLELGTDSSLQSYSLLFKRQYKFSRKKEKKKGNIAVGKDAYFVGWKEKSGRQIKRILKVFSVCLFLNFPELQKRRSLL